MSSRFDPEIVYVAADPRSIAMLAGGVTGSAFVLMTPQDARRVAHVLAAAAASASCGEAMERTVTLDLLDLREAPRQCQGNLLDLLDQGEAA